MGDADDSYDFAEVPRFVENGAKATTSSWAIDFCGGINRGAMPLAPQIHRQSGPVAPAQFIFSTRHRRQPLRHARFHPRHLRSAWICAAPAWSLPRNSSSKPRNRRAQITEIPVILWPDKRGRPPHLRSFRDGWRHLRFLLLYAPNWLFLFPGARCLRGARARFLAAPRPASCSRRASRH